MKLDTLPFSVEKFESREAWLAARQTYGIGSSDVPAILGISRFQSPLALFHSKLGITIEHPRATEQRKWGLLLEEPIAQAYAEETSRQVINPNGDGVWTIARSATHPHMIASLDRVVHASEASTVAPPADGMGVLEIKNAHLYMAQQWVGDESNHEPPVEYQVQLQHQLAVTGLQWGSIAALLGGSWFVWADLPRDESLIARLIEIEGEFMGRLERRAPPPADGSESSRDVLRALYPKDDGSVLQLPAEALEWSEELQTAKAVKKEAEEAEAKYANLLRQAIGESTVGVLPNGTSYSYKWQRRAEVTLAATEFRVLRFNKGKK